MVDDKGKNNLKEIVDTFKDDRIRIIENEENMGLVKSLNRALKEAKGKYVARMDTDDFSYPERLEKQVSAVSFELWIKSLEPVDFKNGVLYLSTTSETAKQRINNLHKGEIFVAVTGSSDEVKDVVILDPVERDAYRQNKEIAVESENKKFPGLNNFNANSSLNPFAIAPLQYVESSSERPITFPFSSYIDFFPYTDSFLISGILSLNFLAITFLILKSASPREYPAITRPSSINCS